jgi:hypothetical protein
MMRLPLAIIAIAALFSCAAVAAVSIAPNQKATVCGKRTTCAVTALHKAGSALVAEIHFGLKDKPDDAPDDGCIMDTNSQKKDGGTEYWLLGTKPLQLLALCNDGYGAADVGDDTVSFSNNRMTHLQEGGSAWRWSTTEIFSLSPFHVLSTDGCSYNDLGSDTGTETVTDELKFRAVAIAKNPSAHFGDDDSVGCLDTKPAMFATMNPYPVAKGVMAFPALTPANGASDFGNVANGTALGTCATTLSTDGKSGFLTFGQPASASDAAYVRVLAPTGESLLMQVYDPAAAKAPAGKSWIAGSHVEVWAANEIDTQGPLKRAGLAQVAIDLDGTLHVVGKAETPKVRRWQTKDENGRPVSVILINWSAGSVFAVGTAVSYSQAEGGKQVRLVSNTPMVRGVPVYIPGIVGMQASCSLKAGRLNVD